jgi:hypothetical protein
LPTCGIANKGFRGIRAFCPATNFVRLDRNEYRISLLTLHSNVISNLIKNMTDENQQQKEQKVIKKGLYNRIMELYLWVFITILVLFPAIYYSIIDGLYHRDFIMEFYNQFLLGTLLLLIPILFNLIFGKLPIEYLNSKREGVHKINIQDSRNINVVIQQPKSEDLNEDYNLQCINESKTIAEKIYTRSGVYLLVGCLIAFIGLAIFYSPIFPKSSSAEIAQRLLDYLPRFGALFFVEFIAFFFLKQYRIMLEEYRYYEAIKRRRQDNLNLVELINTYKDNIDLLKLLTENLSQTVVTRLSKGETTEILETQKIVNQDLDIFGKLTELVKEVKK